MGPQGPQGGFLRLTKHPRLALEFIFELPRFPARIPHEGPHLLTGQLPRDRILHRQMRHRKQFLREPVERKGREGQMFLTDRPAMEYRHSCQRRKFLGGQKIAHPFPGRMVHDVPMRPLVLLMLGHDDHGPVEIPIAQ